MSAPLPADVDLSGMEHMPLFDARLMRSRAWLTAKNWRGEGPGLAFVLINLWCAAFRAVPAGSLEDDDDVLSDLARCDIAHWRTMKAQALAGWFRGGGRVHHPVIGEIALGLWLARLNKRYENTVLSWRAACKRAADKGIEPPLAPGRFEEWLARVYPQTANFLRHAHPQGGSQAPVQDPHGADVMMTDGSDGTIRHTDTDENHCDKRPKRREGNISPLNPPAVPDPGGGETGFGKGKSSKSAGKLWYGAELARLRASFAQMVPTMISHFQKPMVSGEFAFVVAMKGSWLDPGGRCIVMPSKRRADALLADHGVWIRACWPDLAIRHATVDELRAFKARNEI